MQIEGFAVYVRFASKLADGDFPIILLLGNPVESLEQGALRFHDATIGLLLFRIRYIIHISFPLGSFMDGD
ncbi:hypothetical protein [Slackia piriformis]|uniref:hypothetical protein n=1 Tax=Slackia piriformis TaxID=626934 RepID=UPI00058C5449|nr:hypothetical protein [Slackia piriformis]